MLSNQIKSGAHCQALAFAMLRLARGQEGAEPLAHRAIAFLGCALLALAVIGGSWPAALALRDPELLGAWWDASSAPFRTPAHNLKFFIATLSWFAWPAWPLALWAGWSLRRRWADPRVFVPAVAALLMLGGLVYWGPALDVNLIPLLAPLCLFASQGIPTLRRLRSGRERCQSNQVVDRAWAGILTDQDGEMNVEVEVPVNAPKERVWATLCSCACGTATARSAVRASVLSS